jgi:dihydrofolate reductase
VFVVGRATVYEAFRERASRMILTEIHEAYDGETTFPEWDDAAWTEVEREQRDAFDFVTYERVAATESDDDGVGESDGNHGDDE